MYIYFPDLRFGEPSLSYVSGETIVGERTFFLKTRSNINSSKRLPCLQDYRLKENLQCFHICIHCTVASGCNGSCASFILCLEPH